MATSKEQEDEMDTKIATVKEMTGTSAHTDYIKYLLEESDGSVEQAAKLIKEQGVGLDQDFGSGPSGLAVSAPPPAPAKVDSPVKAASPIAPAPPPPANLRADPLMGDLKMMFPTVDVAVVQAVIESHGNISNEDEKLDKCIGDLLQLTDPNFKPETPTPAQQSANAHIDLDEEFARSLALHDQRQLEAERHNTVQGAFQNPQGGDLPYQPRVKRGGAGASGAGYRGGLMDDYEARTAGGAGGYGGYQDDALVQQGYNYRGGAGVNSAAAGLDQKFEKFAGIGKQKFDSFFNKAKSKVNEFQDLQQQRAAQQSSQPQAQGLQGIQGALTGIWTDVSAVATGKRGEEGSRGPSPSGQWGQGQQGSGGQYQQQQQHQAPAASKRWQPTEDYENYTPETNKINVYQPSSATSSSESLPLPGEQAGSSKAAPYDIKGGASREAPESKGGLYPSGSLTDKAGTSPNSSSKIDASKLGMLPKRRVSLLSSSPGSSAIPTSTPLHQQIPQTTKGGEDDEDEFTKNPFDE